MPASTSTQGARHVRTSSTAGTALLLAAVLLLAGCSDDGTQTGPPAAAALSPAASPSPAPSPSPSPSPVPSPTPLSAFEGDPAVVALRAYLAATADAVNAKDLRLPTLVALSTAARAARHPSLFGDDLGSYFPGPRPLAVLGVRAVNASRKDVVGCQLSNYALDAPGGKPLVAPKVEAGTYELVLEGNRWKVDSAKAAQGVTCAGVTPVAP